MAVNIIFWSREAKFSGFSNRKNHTQYFTLFYIQGSVLITFHRFCQKDSEFQVSVNFNGKDSFFQWWDVGFFWSWNPERLLLLCSKLFYCLRLPFNPILQDWQSANTPPSEIHSTANFNVDKIQFRLLEVFSMLLQIYLTS